MKPHPRRHPHHRILQAHEEHERTLSPIEKIGVWAADNLATWQCLALFMVLGAFCLVGAFTNSIFLTLVFGSISSYFIQLVSLSIIGIGTKVGEERTAHVLAKILNDTEELVRIAKGVPITIQNQETGADIIMPNPIRERFDNGDVTSLADII